jgi:predicted dehydrogenase
MTGTSRVAIVGTGSRAQLYTNGLASRPSYTVAALCDPSPTRMEYHNRLLVKAGSGAAALWPPGGFAEMLGTEGITDVVVSTVDAVHDHYIVPAVEAGCRVVTEKPMTVDAARCRAILDATRRTGNPVTVAFNYRYNPVHERVWRLLHEHEIGEVLSVHFEWLLDVRHGADYFRRWHREKASSGGLMVHKASHHFDLVNWWLGSEPREVFGYGRLGFYGADAGDAARAPPRVPAFVRQRAGGRGPVRPGSLRPPGAAGAVPGCRSRQRLHPRPERLRRRDQH